MSLQPRKMFISLIPCKSPHLHHLRILFYSPCPTSTTKVTLIWLNCHDWTSMSNSLSRETWFVVLPCSGEYFLKLSVMTILSRISMTPSHSSCAKTFSFHCTLLCTASNLAPVQSRRTLGKTESLQKMLSFNITELELFEHHFDSRQPFLSSAQNAPSNISFSPSPAIQIETVPSSFLDTSLQSGLIQLKLAQSPPSVTTASFETFSS